MSWLSVPESEGSPSASTQPAPPCDPSVTLKGKPFPPRSWRDAWQKEGWLRHLSGLTSPPSTLDRGVAQWISSLRDSVVSRGPAPASDSGSKTIDGSGQTSLGFFATRDPTSPSSWRTSLAWQAEDSSTFSGIWPRRGSMQSGVCTGHSMLGLPTDALASSSSDTESIDLMDFFEPPSDDDEETSDILWPTAVTTDAASSARHTTTTGIMNSGTMLTDALRIFLVEIQRDLDPDSRLLQTTKKDGATTENQAVLSPRFVEALMGYPTGWSDFEPLATPSSPPSSHERGEPS
jgi:hypothetical protein